MDIDLAQEARPLVRETVRLARVDDRHLTSVKLALGFPVVDQSDTLDHDQDLDVRMAVQARTFSGRRIDEQHARADSAVVLADEVSCDDVLGQLVSSENLDQRLDVPLS